MREIEFQESGMKNFGPYIDPMILEFPNNKLNLLTGPNGIGKTMSLDSIPFTLYGITSKKAKGDDVVNNRVGKNCKTWVKFKVNEDQYLVTRYHKYSKYGNTVILNKNGEDIKKGHREVLPEIERLICPQKAFMNTLMFGQKVKDFFTDLVDSDKKEIFRKILGLEQYIEFYKQTDKFLKTLKDSRDKLITQVEIDKGLLEDSILQIETLKDLKTKFYDKQTEELERLNQTLENNKTFLNDQNSKLNSILEKIDDNLEGIIKELIKVQNELSSLESDIDSKKESIDEQKKMKLLELKGEGDNKKSEIDEEYSSKINELREKENQTKEDLNTETNISLTGSHEIDLQINKLKSNQENNLDSINKLKGSVFDGDESICPTCEQDVTSVKEKLISKMESYQNQIDSDQNKIEEFLLKKEKFLEESNDKLEKLQMQLSEVHELMNKLGEEKDKKKKEIDDKLEVLNNKVNSLVEEQKNNINNSFSEIKTDLENKEKTLLEQKEEQDNIRLDKQEVENSISNVKQQIKTFESQIENERLKEYDETQLISYLNKKEELIKSIVGKKLEIGKAEKEITIHEFWKTAFSSSGIPSMLIDDSIPFMNRKIAEYLDLLTNGRYIVSFDTLAETKAGDFRDKISVHVIDTQTKANSRVQLSGGQTRIVDIATILTLGDLQTNIQDVKINILLFDEIFDALDYDNATYVSKVLNKLKIGKSIYVISHQHQDQLEADEILEFK